MTMTSDLYIGLMSGTSLDGADGILARIPPPPTPNSHTPDPTGYRQPTLQPIPPLQVLASASLPFTATLRQEILALNNRHGSDELHRSALVANAISRIYASVVQALLHQSGIKATDVAAIGAHGQTVRHQPGLHDGTGYTLQIQNPALLAELTGIPVVADIRSRDVAAGGQGAPLVPAFHACMFSQPDAPVLVLNIGGMANISILPATTPQATATAHGQATRHVSGFDCGPGNALMDWWCQQNTGQPYDEDGRWAAGGRISTPLLHALLDEPFLRLPPPKSTGRDLFNPAWLQARLAACPTPLPAQDVQATLTALTAHACADCIRHSRHLPDGSQALIVMVCGGGALNTELMRQLRALLPDMSITSTTAAGMPVLQVEAAAFAWLAQQALHGQPGNLPAVTGARGGRILGAIYPA